MVQKIRIDGIQIVMNEPTPNLCHIIAKKHKKSSGSIERAMHNA
ncbi:MAG: sporulation initiation factor Spo0A C-terminal domain-containing protein [Lachnospiraceae bacterium]|nr:sporulation initiation factor Spo0A C-terminal domain-containing protein [Lachnospiraceae bacterium]